MPKVGDVAPDFNLPGSDGNNYSISQYKNKNNVVLVFYPGDETPTCTKQLCDYRDGWGEFRKYDAVVLGISTNDMKSHKSFVDKFNFQFPLLEDKDLTVCKMYDTLMFMGLVKITKRMVLIIDKSGVIRYKHTETVPIFRRTKEELLDVLKDLK